jgi:hypothetical protein
VRLSRADFCSACKSFFKIEFASQDITAFGGLELIRRYLGLIKFSARSIAFRTDSIAIRSPRAGRFTAEAREEEKGSGVFP